MTRVKRNPEPAQWSIRRCGRSLVRSPPITGRSTLLLGCPGEAQTELDRFTIRANHAHVILVDFDQAAGRSCRGINVVQEPNELGSAQSALQRIEQTPVRSVRYGTQAFTSDREA